MFSSIYAKLASFFLSKIIPSIDTKQISVQNKDGHVVLENLEINPILLIKEKIPFDIKRGIIKSMKISIDSLPNGLVITCNDIILYCNSKQAQFFKEKVSQNFIINLKEIFYHFFSSFASSIGSFYDFTKIKVEVENFHFVCHNEDENQMNTLLSIKIPTISYEPSQNENDTSKNLRFLSISISFYNILETSKFLFDDKVTDFSFEEFQNSLNSIFSNSNEEKIIVPCLIFDDFSISCLINSSNELSEIKIDSDEIHIKSELNQFYRFINLNEKIEEKNKIMNLWKKTYKYFLKTKVKPTFKIETALSFLKNREKYSNLISTETDFEKVDQFVKEAEINQETKECLQFYTNDAISEKFNVSDQLSIQSNKKLINFFLSIPSINIEFQDEDLPILTLQFNQIKGEYHFDNKTNKGSFQIQDFFINGTKVSESQPFLNSQDDTDGQSIELSKCLFVIKKEYEEGETEKVDYLKILNIEKQLKEYKTLFQLINLLSQSRKLNHFLFLGNRMNKMICKGNQCKIHLQYFSKNKTDDSNSNEDQNIHELPKFDLLISINSYTTQFERFKFKKAIIDFEGISLNKNQMLLPLKLSINSNKLVKTLTFGSELIELKMNNVYFKKTIDIFKAIQSVLNIHPNADLIVKIDEIKIHLSVNLIMSCSDFISKQKFVNNSKHFSSSFSKFKILDCNRLFLSFDSFKVKQNDISINDLIFILNAPALNYLFSLFSFDELQEKYRITILNISIKLPFSEVVILALVDRINYDGEGKLMINSFSAKSGQEEINNQQEENLIQVKENSSYLVDPISFVINISHDESNHTRIHYQVDQLNINFDQEEVKNLLEAFSFFKNFFILKNVNFESQWDLNSIKFLLRKSKFIPELNDDIIACIEIQFLTWTIISKDNEFSSKIECQSIINSKDYECKFINTTSPICLSYKQIDKNVEAFITANDIDLFLSPELIMFNIDLYGISKLNIVNYEYVIQANNINVSLYDNDKYDSFIFETIHLDEVRISSIQKGNFSFSFKNIKSISNDFELPSFELQMINSVITYKMPDSSVKIKTNSYKLDKFEKFFSDINLRLPNFLTFGIDININQIEIQLVDTNQSISISKFIFKLNTSEKIAVISVSEISYENILTLNNCKVMIHFHVNDPNSNQKEIVNVLDELKDVSTDIDVKGDVLNPMHYEYINVVTKIDNISLILNQRLYQKVKYLFNYHFIKMFNKRNNKWLIKEIKMNLSSFDQDISFVLKNVDSYFSFSEKKFHLKINNADILPGNLLTKKNDEDTFISIHYDFINKQNNYLSILIKESVLKLDIKKFLAIYYLFDSVNSLIPLSLIVEKMLIIFENEKGSPFHIYLDFKISKNLQILNNSTNENEAETVFELESNIYSMNFVERKPLVQDLQLSIKVDNNRNLSITISDCSFLLSLFVRELIKSMIAQLKKLSFLIEDFNNYQKHRFLINSITLTTGKISIIFCKVSFQPSFRITLSPFTTHFSSKQENNKSFDVFSSIDFVNDKINDWDYLVEPFKLTILPSLQIFKDDIKGGVYHSFDIKVNVDQNLNINLPLLLLQNDDMFDQEEKDLFEKISKNNKLFELPDLFIKNNLNTQVSVKISPRNIYFVMVPQQLLPIYVDENPSLFEINAFDKTFKFSLDEIIYPTIFSTCLSIVKRGRRIELNSPVQIQSLIDRMVIDLYEKGDGEFNQIASLEPHKLYPLYFNSNKPKECMFITENDKIKDKKHHTVLISPFDSEGDQNIVISGEQNKNYYVLIHADNDKSGKIVKMHSSVVCQNLLPFSLFIRVKSSKNQNNETSDQFPICKNDTVDLLTVNPEIGSKFYAELSMNGIDFSNTNKLIIELSPSKETSIHESSSMNFLLDLNSESSLKLQTITIFDCRIEKEISINVKFEKLFNGQIKMILFSPFIFANLTDSDLMILNGSSVTHLPIHNWSVLTPKTEGLIFTQKDDKIVLSINGYEKQEIQYNPPNKKYRQKTYFQSIFLEHQKNEDPQNCELQSSQNKSSAFDSFINLFSKKNNDEQLTNNSTEDKAICLMPLRLKITKHKISDEILEVIISDLITVKNDTDKQIDFEYASVLPHTTSKITNIKKIHELSFHFNGSQIQKTISLDIVDNKIDNHVLNGSFRAAFLIEDNQRIEVNVINQEVNLFILFKESIFPTPLIITNELLDSDNQPIPMKVYHTDPNNFLLIQPFTTSPFYFDDLQNLDTINVVLLLNQNQHTKSFSISLLNESNTTEVNDPQNNLNFSITVKINQEIQLLKSVILSSRIRTNNDDIYSNVLNYFRFKIDLKVPSIMTSVIDLNMNEILLISNKSFSFAIDNTIDIESFFSAFLNNNKLSFSQYGIQTICNFSIKSLQVDIQSNIIPRVFSPTIFKSNGTSSKTQNENENEDDFISVTFFSNSINKYINISLCDSMSVSSDPVSLAFFLKLLKSLKNKVSFGKFDWFEVSHFSFHFSYQESSNSTENSITRRRASFSITDVLNNNPKTATVSIPGIVFGQFDGDFVNEVIQTYLNKYIKPILASSIPSLQIQIEKEKENDDEEDTISETDNSDIMAKKISENLTTSYGCVNRSSLVSLALSLVNEKMKTPHLMMNIIAGITSYSKNLKKLRNGFIFYINTKDRNEKSDTNDNNDNEHTKAVSSAPSRQQQWTRMPRCYPRFSIGIYDQNYSKILILIRNRFRNKERVRMVSKCTVTNDVVVLTDSYLIIISPTLEFISNEISILEIRSVAVVESELRLAGKKESEKIMLRLDSEKTSKIFSIFIASQRLALGMFGMSMIDK